MCIMSCSICLGYLSNSNYCEIRGCCHRFHFRCLQAWLLEKGNCPICRAKVEFIDNMALTMGGLVKFYTGKMESFRTMDCMDDAVNRLYCKVCRVATVRARSFNSSNEDEMVFCGGCNFGFHCECVGLETWNNEREYFCEECNFILHTTHPKDDVYFQMMRNSCNEAKEHFVCRQKTLFLLSESSKKTKMETTNEKHFKLVSKMYERNFRPITYPMNLTVTNRSIEYDMPSYIRKAAPRKCYTDDDNVDYVAVITLPRPLSFNSSPPELKRPPYFVTTFSLYSCRYVKLKKDDDSFSENDDESNIDYLTLG